MKKLTSALISIFFIIVFWDIFVLSAYATKRTNNNKTYEIRNDMGPLNIFSFNYSQLLITDQNGDVKIIYDVNSYQITKYIIIIIIIISIIVFIIIPTIYKLYKDGKKKHNIYF